MAEGRQEGESLLLQRQLAFKFKPLDKASLARLAASGQRYIAGVGRAGVDGGESGHGV